ncbi:extracellular solute-binding protein [Cellulomonas sp. ES6]|uniref:extracellular solute-binding protein n=2 Tax=unclassified Cellulomonas TaxID=2620175 RepID=UPI0024B7070A|nr:extracellular solute-binding protein [Cellulomonas sp. ES6]WHP18899.1 extracellular solute-binding protein [Cellulomonas sp. ES6]
MSTMQRIRGRRALGAAGLLAAGGLVLAACGSAEDPGDSAGGTSGGDGDGVTIDFWYSVSGVPADTLTALVDEFNEEHDDITVNAVFQGSYVDSMAKLTNSVQSGALPDVVQGGDTFSTYLNDTGLTVAPGEVAGVDGTTFDGEDLVPVLASYYTFGGELTSVPIMVSQPVVLYNTAMLEAAGVDPADAPGSITELFETATAVHDATGTAGLTMFLDPWWSEQFTASEGLEYCTPENGVGAEPADAFQYTTDAQVGLWEHLQRLVQDGSMLNTGTDGSASLTAFAAEEAAIMVQSSRIFGDAERAAAFDFGVWPLPVGSPDGGAVPGGNSVWLVDEGSTDESRAASATFVQYLASPEVQERIFLETGYLPTSQEALASLEGQTTDVQQVALDQLARTTDSVPSAGCHTGAMNEARDAVRSAIEAVVGGADVAATWADAEQRGNDAIASYLDRLG